MEWRVRHRQPKGTETDGPSCTPPRRPSTRPPLTDVPLLARAVSRWQRACRQVMVKDHAFMLHGH